MSPDAWQWRCRWAGLCLFAVLSFVAEAARAHIDLSVPEPREHGRRRGPNANLKEGPCGQLENGRTTSVNVFAPGETIEVTWAETTNHRSYYRVAFDRSGDDAFPTFEGPGTGAEGIDPSGPCPVDGQVILAYDMDDRSGGSHTLRVRLPDVECDSCTLQVVQFMYDTARPYYFQCADLALRHPGAGDAGANDEAPRDAGFDAGTEHASDEPDPSAAAGCWSRITPLSAMPMPTADDIDVESAGMNSPSESSPPAPTASAAAPLDPSPRARSDGGLCSFDPRASSRAPHLSTALLVAVCALLATTKRGARR